MTPTPDNVPSSTSRRPPRSERRIATIDAFIDLVLETGTAPRPEEVAERSEVSIASLYRYFDSLDDLRREAITRLMDRFPELFVLPSIGDGERSKRITCFVSARFELHETLHPLQLLTRAKSQSDDDAIATVNSTRQALADQIQLHFDTELSTLTAAERRNTVATISVLTSVESWEQFRRTLSFTPRQTRGAWTAAIEQLLPKG